MVDNLSAIRNPDYRILWTKRALATKGRHATKVAAVSCFVARLSSLREEIGQSR